MAEQNPKSKSIPPHVKAIAGSIGGMVEACCLQPIDVIKTRLQLDRSGSYRGTRARGSSATVVLAGFGAGVIEALVIVTPFEQTSNIRLQRQRGLTRELLKYKGLVDCARTIIREEGLRGLWAGAATTVMRNGINQATMFTAKNAFDRVLWDKQEGDGKVLQPWQLMISGFLAGVAGPVCIGPFDVVKTKLMAQSRSKGEVKYKGMVHAIVTIYKEERLRALWKGLLSRLMRIPPGQVIMWTMANQVTGFYERRYIHNSSS
ncbi:hypothetical protein RHGRI_010520 [Rhododendron griersonianum]|uniref:Uncharacterized protein n=1 Tax=Rhododendron griersonianum TaxID=479676 RepID=A0AAV6KIX9_9ERIC|nr:hypothetical protein RHGRI_010520 [Rhododendron griersonianum]